MHRQRSIVAFVSLALVAIVFACTPTPSSTDADATGSLAPASSTSAASADWRHPKSSAVAPTPNPAWYGEGNLAPRTNIHAASMGSVPPPVFQASWLTTDWYIDPVAGNDTASCTVIGSPCKTYAQVVARLGTYWPRFRQTVTFHFLSGQTDNTDPFILHPFVENGASVIAACTLPAPSQTGTLASVTSKVTTQGSSALLTGTIGAGGVIGQLVVNTTHPSRAFLNANTSGNVWTFTQPLVALVPPFGAFSSGTEVNTWATSDAFSTYTLPQLFVEDFEPLMTSNQSPFGTPGFISGCHAFGGLNISTINTNVSVSESLLDPTLVIVGGASDELAVLVNDFFSNGINFTSAPYSVNAGINTFASVRGGSAGVVVGGPFDLSADTILSVSGLSTGLSGTLGPVYIGSGVGLTLLGPTQVRGVVWGPGTLDIGASTRLTYPSAGGAAAANLRTTTLQVNGGTTACSHTGATPDVVSCGITISATNLDTAQSTTTFGGLAYVPGGGSISNGGL